VKTPETVAEVLYNKERDLATSKIFKEQFTPGWNNKTSKEY